MPPRDRTRRGRGAAATALAALALLALPASPPATAQPTEHSYQLTDGVTLKTINYDGEPNQVRVLIVTPGPGVTVDLGVSTAVFGGYQAVSGQATDNGAIAAINGDFSLDAAPVHWDEIDAELRTSGIQDGVGFAVSKDETRAWAAHPDFETTLTSAGGTDSVARWNAGDAAAGEIAAFTKTGGSVDHPGTDMCAARLTPAGPYAWTNAQQAGVSRAYTVDAQPEPCRFRSLPIGATGGNVVLNARRACACAQVVKDLQVGDAVTLAWKTVGWKGVLDEIGGQPMLVKDGKNVGPPASAGTSYFYKNNPRTGVGVNAGCVDIDTSTVCKVFYVTVDGRQASSGWSQGMTLRRFADEFVKLGAVDAINLDGGGSTTMWVAKTDPAYCEDAIDGGCLVNRPSGGQQRAVPDSVQVLPGDDPGEPAGFARTHLPPLADPGVSTDAAWGTAALTDPGSTGGLLDALDRAGTLPDLPAFRAGLRTYRRSVG